MAATALGLCGAITAAVYVKGVRPVFIESSVAAEARASLRQQQEKFQQIQETKRLVQSQYQRVQKELSASPLRLKAAPRRNVLFAQIAKMAAEAGLTLNKLTPGQPFRAPRYKVIPVVLEAQADFPTCVQFVHSLCGRFPDVGVIGIDLGSHPANPQTVRLELKIEWYASLGPSAK